MNSDFAIAVYEYLLTIPKGKVVTYARLAKAIGHPGAARAVGNALHNNPDPEKYPCYKVVNSKGGLAKNFALGIDEQRKRLEKDGIAVKEYRVDLDKYNMQ